MLEGIHRVQVTVQGQVHDLIEGLNDVQIKILRLFGNEVCHLYSTVVFCYFGLDHGVGHPEKS
jgi:hypothetical protein